MKAMSDRRSQKDLDDAAVLFNALRLKNWMDIDEIVHRYYGVESAGAQELFLKISKIVPMRFGSKDRFRNDF